MKHIAIFVPQFPVPSETFVLTEIESLRLAGHQVSVITMEHLPTDKVFDFKIIELSRSDISLALSALKNVNMTHAHQAIRAASQQKSISNTSLMYFALLSRFYINKYKIEHIHCHFMHSSLAYGIVAAKLSGISVSSVGHGHDVYVNRSDLPEKMAHCDFNVAVCQDMLSLLTQYKSTGVKLLHCGVDTARFKSFPSPNNAQLKLLFIGRLVDKKGLEYALQAIEAIKPALRPELTIVGGGPLRERLTQLANELDISKNIFFLGHQTPEQIIRLASCYDAFIAPFCIADNGDKDTGPVVLKEAMAMGLPVITTNIMGCTEIVDESCGYTVPSKDSSVLKAALLSFIHLSKAQRAQMRCAARERVNTYFDARKQAKQLSQWIEQV